MATPLPGIIIDVNKLTSGRDDFFFFLQHPPPHTHTFFVRHSCSHDGKRTVPCNHFIYNTEINSNRTTKNTYRSECSAILLTQHALSCSSVHQHRIQKPQTTSRVKTRGSILNLVWTRVRHELSLGANLEKDRPPQTMSCISVLPFSV